MGAAMSIVLALPKGRILKEAGPMLAHAGLVPEPEYTDENLSLIHISEPTRPY